MSPGQVLFVRSSTTSSSRRQCDGGGRSGLFSDSDSFYQLCQLSALPASILRLSEQTKTGATEATKAGLARGGISNILSR